MGIPFIQYQTNLQLLYLLVYFFFISKVNPVAENAGKGTSLTVTLQASSPIFRFFDSN